MSWSSAPASAASKPPRALRRAPVERHPDRPAEPPLLPAAALPGGDRGAVAGRHRLADPRTSCAGRTTPTVLLAEVTGVDIAGRRVHARAARRDALRLSRHRDRRDATPTSATTNGRSSRRASRRIDDATAHPPHASCSPSSRPRSQHDPAERQRLLTFVIVGGGADRRGDGRRHRRDRAADAGHAISAASTRARRASCWSRPGRASCRRCPPDLSDYARPRADAAWASRSGPRRAVTGCDARRRRCRRRAGSTPAPCIWAAGVQASPAARWLGAEPIAPAGSMVEPGPVACPAIPRSSSSATRRSARRCGRAGRCPASRRRPSRWAAMSAS